MLLGLNIRDIVLIDRLDLALRPGLCVLTGETGAGKSILLDALGLALGKRAESGLVRPGAQQAAVSAEFSIGRNHPAHAILREAGLDGNGEAIVLRRLVGADGRSRAFVNDEPASVGLLRDLGDSLVEIQGQFEQRGLLDPANHRMILDALAEHSVTPHALAKAWHDWREARQREADAARERHATTEREINRHAARKSALTEARTRLAADRNEAHGAHESANEALAELPPSAPTEARLAEVKAGIDGCRRVAAQVRAEAQALAREAELADRRLQAITAESNEWRNRKTSATSQVETIETRVNEVGIERAELENAPAIFAEKRRALINEIEAAETARRVAADALAAAENVMAATDRAAATAIARTMIPATFHPSVTHSKANPRRSRTWRAPPSMIVTLSVRRCAKMRGAAQKPSAVAAAVFKRSRRFISDRNRTGAVAEFVALHPHLLQKRQVKICDRGPFR